MAARAKPYPPEDLYAQQRQRVYRGNQLSQIAFPLGGIGAGCICLNGYGGLQDFSVRNRPTLTAAPEADGYADAAFAVRVAAPAPKKIIETASTTAIPAPSSQGLRAPRVCFIGRSLLSLGVLLRSRDDERWL